MRFSILNSDSSHIFTLSPHVINIHVMCIEGVEIGDIIQFEIDSFDCNKLLPTLFFNKIFLIEKRY